jgi:hypothetical protein
MPFASSGYSDRDGEKLYSDEGQDPGRGAKDAPLLGHATDMGAMALHFKTFEVFIKLYMPDLTEIQKAILKQSLEQLYDDLGITWDTDVRGMKPADFPTFKDL